MRRRITLLLVFLFLGAIINVALAWGCFVWSRGQTRTRIAPPHVIELLHWCPTGWKVLSGSQEVVRSFGLRCDTAAGFHPDDPPALPVTADQFVEVARAGWPMYSVWRSSFVHGPRRPPNTPFASLSGSMHVAGYDLPVAPLFVGFVIDTVFYAAILWLLFVAPFAWRRRRRITRGLCLKCAYPVGTSAVCTECGAMVCGTLPA